MRHCFKTAFIFLIPISLLSSAQAIGIISNFPSNDSVASDLDATFSKAVGFTMPSGVPYTLDSATISLFIEDLGAQTAYSFGLFADASGNPDIATPLVNLTLPTLALGDFNYALTPATPFTLQPNTTYWLVGSSSSLSSYGGWNRNAPSKTPTGLALSAGARAGNPPTTANLFFNSYSIEATPLPIPLPLLGVSTAFAASRTLRKRLCASGARRPPSA